MKHILVPTDFSKTANRALKHALPLAQSAGSRVTLLHVIFREALNEALGLDAIELLSKSMDIAGEKSTHLPAYDLAALRTAASHRLDELAQSFDQASLKIETAVCEGRPSLEIVDFAKKNDVELIVMGTHGRGPVGRMFLGSVTENVIRSAHCPVMAVRK